MYKEIKRVISLILVFAAMSTNMLTVSAAGITAEDENESTIYIDDTCSEDYDEWLYYPYLWDNSGYFYGDYEEGYQNPNVYIEPEDEYRWFEIEKGNYKGERFCLKNGNLVTGLAIIDGNTYCFKSNGLMVRSNWVTCNGDRFYISSSGYALKGWYEINGDTYYFNKDSGAAATGIVKIKDVKYAFNYDGKLIKEDFVKVSKSVYYADSDGKVVTGWKKIDGDYYYFKSNGKRVTGMVEIDGVMYQFNSKGVYQYRLKELK